MRPAPAPAAACRRCPRATGAARDAVAGGKERIERRLHPVEFAEIGPAQVYFVRRGSLVDTPRDDLMGVGLVLLRNLPAAYVTTVRIDDHFGPGHSTLLARIVGTLPRRSITRYSPIPSGEMTEQMPQPKTQGAQMSRRCWGRSGRVLACR